MLKVSGFIPCIFLFLKKKRKKKEMLIRKSIICGVNLIIGVHCTVASDLISCRQIA